MRQKLTSFKTPNTYAILLSILVLMAVLTWILPGSQYDRVEINGRLVVDPDTFTYVEAARQGIPELLMAPIRGFVNAAEIIGFVLLIGGVFGILQRTQAIETGVRSLARAHQTSKLVRTITIPLFMVLFSLGGAIFGMAEETIPFILIFVPMAYALGYDTVTGIAIPFIGAGAGFAGAFLNPFTVGVAQGIAQLPLFSGLAYRVLCWTIVTAIAIIFVMRHAARVKANPQASPTYEHDEEGRRKLHLRENDGLDSMSKSHKLVLYVFVLGILALVYGVLKLDWYIEEIMGLFLLIGLLAAIIGRLSVDSTTEAFLSGAKDLMGTALVIGLARAILILAENGHIIATILHSLAGLVGGLHPVVSAQAMFVIQTFLNFFVPSGSGQAALTMPIMAPLADLIGVTRQTAVLAFQFGDGFSNLIIPTSGVAMGVLSLAGVPWEKWARWIIPLELIFLLIGFLLLIPPVLMGWQ
ncbi:MAG: YfcC family protein [Candidatus Marinimicrobia bacterium]|nr:YfcC family protein [Candidatus Neomarinimicrobiota bacterium]